ncbi:nuclear transport factor 2 family protein [Caulobacter sp. 73W]|uniref:Nuclear transport factor 2 family protein n=1 Tax=Caulobacter sp. 73W TaxID=3161137 RepID=A0AB39KSW1_9CAUL
MTKLRTLAIGTVAGLAAPASLKAAEQAQGPSQAQSNRTIVSSAFDRWSVGQGDFFTEVLSLQVIWTIEGSGPSAGVYRGLDDFVVRAVQPFADRMQRPVRPIAKRVWAEGEHVIVNWSGEGMAGDGKPYQNDYVWIFRLQDGKAVEVTAFLDLPAYDDVLRRVPAPPLSLP